MSPLISHEQIKDSIITLDYVSLKLQSFKVCTYVQSLEYQGLETHIHNYKMSPLLSHEQMKDSIITLDYVSLLGVPGLPISILCLLLILHEFVSSSISRAALRYIKELRSKIEFMGPFIIAFFLGLSVFIRPTNTTFIWSFVVMPVM
jgi:hypothetical protein